MTNIYFLILKLRKYAFILFLVPTIGLLGSLFFHNLLINYEFIHWSYEEGKRYPSKITCNVQNNYCKTINVIKTQNLDDCPSFYRNNYYLVNGKKINIKNYKEKYLLSGDLKKKFLSEKIEKVFSEEEFLINNSCIKNSSYYNIYKKVPFIFELLSNLKSNKKYAAATSEAVYPFLYGESSISNIVKRFPINYLFKPLLYISSILMMMYWLYYQKIFNLFEKEKKINKFLIFGVTSSIFLFFHVLFLGTEIENEIFKKLRRLIIVLFIFCELAAQFFLARRIYICKTLILTYTFKPIVYLKIAFVATIILISISILGILTFSDLPPAVDYFLEWNYFLILLIFYLLSSIMWKKPPSTQHNKQSN